MSDGGLDWYREKLAVWAAHERSFSALIIQFSGTSFACVLGLIFVPVPSLLTLATTALIWFGVIMLCLCSHEVEHCRKWQDWHRVMIANPLAWPWPSMPGEA